MLSIVFHKDFKKDYLKLNPKTREHFRSKYELFIENPFHELLRSHPLKGRFKGLWSFSVESDIRVIYRHLNKNTVLLLRIGTHNQVY